MAMEENCSSDDGGSWMATSAHEDGKHSDKFCAKVEWWNPETGESGVNQQYTLHLALMLLEAGSLHSISDSPVN